METNVNAQRVTTTRSRLPEIRSEPVLSAEFTNICLQRPGDQNNASIAVTTRLRLGTTPTVSVPLASSLDQMEYVSAPQVTSILLAMASQELVQNAATQLSSLLQAWKGRVKGVQIT